MSISSCLCSSWRFSATKQRNETPLYILADKSSYNKLTWWSRWRWSSRRWARWRWVGRWATCNSVVKT